MRVHKISISLILITLVFPITTWCQLGWVNISNATLEQLDVDSYRLRIDIDWGGDNFAGPGGPYYSQCEPWFDMFKITTVGTPFNIFDNSGYDPLDPPVYPDGLFNIDQYDNWIEWERYDFMTWYRSGNLPNQIGYDFDYAGPIGEGFLISYESRLEWEYTYSPPELSRGYIFNSGYSEDFNGSLRVSTDGWEVVPEPATVFLVGLGLIGAGIVRRFKR